MSGFELDQRLARDSEDILSLGLCQLRVMNDRRWPWLLLVPERRDVSEIFELSRIDQSQLSVEVNMVGAALKAVTGAEKINIGALGNIVRQLHIHVIARSTGDANWPGPVWGHGTPEPYGEQERHLFVRKILEALSS
jgi:diadenosine tetraphosphate (Ap4A) HIT family hydrolase